MPAKPSRRAKNKNPAQTAADRKLIEDIGYQGDGGWSSAVRDVIYFLRCNRRQSDADDLEMATHRAHILTPYPDPIEEQQVILERVSNSLAAIKNSPKGDLKPKKREELSLLLNKAIERLRQGLETIPGQLRRGRRAARNWATAVPAEPPKAEASGNGLELVPGGFSLAGKVHDLTGRPRDMLEALLKSLHRRCAASELREAMRVDDEAVTYPEQVVKDAAKKLRAALKKAAESAGKSCQKPLRAIGEGAGLTYILDMS